MTQDKEYVLDSMRRQGKSMALALQAEAPRMTGTALNAQAECIPDFSAAVHNENMKNRKPGFVCKSPSGRVVKLLQPYDSSTYTGVPEDLPAQWGFVWSQDPAHALPFVAMATSPYGKGDCCTEDGQVFRSKQNGNVHAPSAWPAGWEVVV